MWLSDNKVKMKWVVVFEDKSLMIQTKYVKVLQRFILSQIKFWQLGGFIYMTTSI